MVMKEGQIFESHHHISAETIRQFAQLSGDKNLIHVDRAYAKNQGFDGQVAHGLISLGFVSAQLTSIMGEGNILVSIEAKFVRPVIEGTDIKLFLTLERIDPRFDQYTFTFQIWNMHDNKSVIRGSAKCIQKNRDNLRK